MYALIIVGKIDQLPKYYFTLSLQIKLMTQSALFFAFYVDRKLNARFIWKCYYTVKGLRTKGSHQYTV